MGKRFYLKILSTPALWIALRIQYLRQSKKTQIIYFLQTLKEGNNSHPILLTRIRVKN